MKPKDLPDQESQVAERYREICNEMIVRLEDRLPGIAHPLEKDQIIEEIDALLVMVDQANERAAELLKKYQKKESNNGYEKIIKRP